MSPDEKYQTLRKETQALKAENERLRRLLGIKEIDHNELTHGDTIPAKESIVHTEDGLTKNSPPDKKIQLYMSLFRGRREVYAKRWENRLGRAGYSPDCSNEWKPGICRKPKIKCSQCSHQQFKELNVNAIEKHLKGEMVAGIYPLLKDDTCYFLAMDFDEEDWQKDIKILRQTAMEKNIPFAIERSRSGNGAHLWFFFEEAVPAVTARKFGSALLSYAMNLRHELSFRSYDRLFPNQDRMPKGGFGNLIALPLQKEARKKSNSVFIDEKFQPYPDQWKFLDGVNKISMEQISIWTKLFSEKGELGTLRTEEEEEETPWIKRKKTALSLSRSDFPAEMTIILADGIYIPKAGLSQQGLNLLKRQAAFGNPQFYKAQAMRMPVYNKPRIISCAEETNKFLCLPRGCKGNIEELLSPHLKKIHWKEKRNKGKAIKVSFTGELRTEQQGAVENLIRYNNGVLSAPPAFGKTVLAAWAVAKKKRATLILVHRQQLLVQWKKRLEEFLNITADQIGQLGGGKTTPSGFIDIGMIQSFIRSEELQACLKDYGMVIVDECHHIPAFSFEKVIKQVNAKYVYGLTATPERHDGHHPIVFMQCGPIRYKVDVKKEAEKRPFVHYVIPRFTGFILPENTDPENNENRWTIQEVYRELVLDDMRNQFIADDVFHNYKEGRSALILTERVEHIKKMEGLLKERIPDIIILTGSGNKKKNKLAFEKIATTLADRPMTIIATGKYIGEGFDEPRLNTLFLAMPISWKGMLQQYTGRLHRLHVDKKEVRVYDYVDVRVKMLERMYIRRLSSYAALGYKMKGENISKDTVDIIFDKSNFLPVFRNDVLSAKMEWVIVSPYVSLYRVKQMLVLIEEAIDRNVKITVVTRPVSDYKKEDKIKLDPVFELMRQKGITMKYQSKIHQKFAIMDQRTVWYGSINLLSYGRSEESIMRIESGHIAGVLMKSMDSH